MVVALGLLAGQNARTEESKPKSVQGAYRLLHEKAATVQSERETQGWSYVISGGVALAVAIPGFYLSSDVFARAVYSVGQTLAVAAVGYGSYLALVEDDYARFATVLSTPGSRDELAAAFLRSNAARASKVRKIRVITHALTAGLNFMNGFTASQRELKTTLFFLGGINTFAAVGIGVSRSEEERLAGSLELGLDLRLHGAGLALRTRF